MANHCKLHHAIALCSLLILTAACSAPRNVTPPPEASTAGAALQTSTPTRAPSATPSPTRVIATATPRPKFFTRTPAPTRTPTITLTPTATSLGVAFEPALIGTALPEPAVSIAAANLPRLAQVGMWGKGTIRAAAFNPDGRSFAVGSAYGVAIYSLAALDQPARWLPFEQPVLYTSMVYSPDGQALLLEGEDKKASRAFDLVTGRYISPLPEFDWVRLVYTIPDTSTDFTFTSPDGSRRFEGGVSYRMLSELDEDDVHSESAAHAYVFDAHGEEPIYFLDADLPYVYHSDWNTSEGCDLDTFSPCGNGLLPVPTSPYRAAFSPENTSLAVIYRAYEYFYPSQYSTLRLYRAQDGKLLHIFGSFDQPVEDFAYTPDGRGLLVAYVDGIVELWHIAGGQSIFRSVDFSQKLGHIVLTPDGEFIILDFSKTVQIRSSRDGALLASFTAATYTLSPEGDRIAIGAPDGKIGVYSMTGGDAVHLEGHRGQILALVFSSDGRYLASSSDDCTIKYWDLDQGKLAHGFENVIIAPYANNDFDITDETRIFVRSLDFIPQSGQLFGMGSWDTVAAWDAATGAVKFVVPSDDFYGYNPLGLDIPGNRFEYNSQVYDLTTGIPLGPAAPEAEIEEAESAFDCDTWGPQSPNGGLELSLGGETRSGQVCFLEAASQELLGVIEVLPYDVADDYSLRYPEFSPDGDKIYVPVSDGVVFVYQVVSK